MKKTNKSGDGTPTHWKWITDASRKAMLCVVLPLSMISHHIVGTHDDHDKAVIPKEPVMPSHEHTHEERPVQQIWGERYVTMATSEVASFDLSTFMGSDDGDA